MANLAEYGGAPKFETDADAEQYWTGASGTKFENAIIAPMYWNTTAGELRIWDNTALALGQITTGIVGLFDDGDLLIMTDALGVTVTFEIDESGTNTPAAGNIEIDINGAADAAAVADLIRTAIEAELAISADAPGTAQIDLTQDDGGVAGRTTITYTPAAAGTGIVVGASFALAWQAV